MAGAAEPSADCQLCPRLAAFRRDNREAYPGFHNAPVPSFGETTARLLIVGLAPGLQGANRTGRPFTGDYAGELLYKTLLEFGFASGTFKADPNDGLTLVDCMITNAVRCVPPQNKPTGEEAVTCRRFFTGQMAALPNLKVIVALGKIAHDAVLSARAERKVSCPFRHGNEHAFADGRVLIDSYHCSRYNTNTRVLTEPMFRAVFTKVRHRLEA